jgi:hypothetical protein
MRGVKIPNWLVTVSVIPGIIILAYSAIWTFRLFHTTAPGVFGVLAGIIGGCVDFGKSLFLPVSLVCLFKKYYGAFAYYFILWLICFSISLVASNALDLNKATASQDEALKNSTQYQQLNEKHNALLKSYKDNTTKHANLIDSKNQNERISKVESSYTDSIKNAQAMNYITTANIGVVPLQQKQRKAVEDERSNIASEIKETETNKKNDKSALDAVEKELKELKSSVTTSDNIIEFANWFAKFFKVKDPQVIIGNFYMIKNISLEFIGLGFLWLPLLLRINGSNLPGGHFFDGFKRRFKKFKDSCKNSSKSSKKPQTSMSNDKDTIKNNDLFDHYEDSSISKNVSSLSQNNDHKDSKDHKKIYKSKTINLKKYKDSKNLKDSKNKSSDEIVKGVTNNMFNEWVKYVKSTKKSNNRINGISTSAKYFKEKGIPISEHTIKKILGIAEERKLITIIPNDGTYWKDVV